MSAMSDDPEDDPSSSANNAELLTDISQLESSSPPPSSAYSYEPAPSKFTDTPVVQKSQYELPANLRLPPIQSSRPTVIARHQQQSDSSVQSVVQNQPRPRIYHNAVPPVRDHYLTLSAILSVVCCLCGTWYGLCCTIPAIYFSIQAQEADGRGDMTAAESHANTSLALNVGALIIGGIGSIVSIGIVVLRLS